jgi:16S rRNA C1402 (ribose-2'-O) methylase RsmI
MAAFEAAARLKSLCVGFESPKRVVSLLKDFVSYAGPGQMVIVARELTKTYEQVIRAEAGSILARIERQELPTLGEWVIAFEPHSNAVEGWQEVARSLSAVWEKKKLSQWVAAHFYVSKQEVYDFLIGKIS